MKFYQSIRELLDELDVLNWDAALFMEPKLWASSPQDAPLLYLEGDDELEDVVDGTHLPKIADEHGMRQLLDIETFRDVVEFEGKRNDCTVTADIIHAVNYYREKDDFYDPPR